MNFAGHVSLGCVSWLGYTALINDSFEAVVSAQTLVLMPVAIFGALLPDIDHPNSTFGRRIRPVSTVLSWFSHRGITHSIWAIAGSLYVLSAFDLSMLWIHALTIGYVSHLLGDSITPAGIKPFWPVPYRFYINPYIAIPLVVVLALIFQGA
ncbi:metal-dependent hydrolase [Shewanella sp. SG44-6]|jgi:inner membrane protein|uniref:metal-dependent hydrolase n=1 Tax=Shewanella sp. SG44-6 TaxID=2760959 RepID=UPI00160192EB|nr:metal-dependent hydrolase [Shewanella sp. SG44-6]MBB1390221.1 metal-dependent hydrolase [Shewanella sp. SG44-6]